MTRWEQSPASSYEPPQLLRSLYKGEKVAHKSWWQTPLNEILMGNPSGKIQPGHRMPGLTAKCREISVTIPLPLGPGWFCSVYAVQPYSAALRKSLSRKCPWGAMRGFWHDRLAPSLTVAIAMDTRGQAFSTRRGTDTNAEGGGLRSRAGCLLKMGNCSHSGF